MIFYLDNFLAVWAEKTEKEAKAELLQVGIFFLIHLFAWEILLLQVTKFKKYKSWHSKAR